MDWRSLKPDDLARSYSPSSKVGDIEPFIRRYKESSVEAKRGLCRQLIENISYGEAEEERLDLFLPERSPGGPGFPLAVFVHGGYWQELSKNEHAFPAPAWLSAGYGFAALSYGLAPDASVARMITRCRQAIDWLADNAGQYGYDPDNISAIGHSAGAHLIASAISPNLAGEGNGRLLKHPAKSILIGGIYDLEPICHTYVNEPLGLDPASARKVSPLYHSPDPAVELVIIYAERETDEFIRQSREYAQHCLGVSRHLQIIQVDGRHHFDIIFDIADSQSSLFQKISCQTRPHVSQ